MSEVAELKKQLAALQLRIDTLEQKAGLAHIPKSIRMVLIGPPGAGTLKFDFQFILISLFI